MSSLSFPESDSSSDPFGFTCIKPLTIDHDEDRIQKCLETSRQNNWIVLNNVLNGLSWLVSPIIGVIRIILACVVDDGADEEYFGGLIARGIAEILCLGPLLMIVDLVITIFRYSNCSCCSREFT